MLRFPKPVGGLTSRVSLAAVLWQQRRLATSSRCLALPVSSRPAVQKDDLLHAAARGKKISQARQREHFPGIRRETKKFEGEHTFNHLHNTMALLVEARAFLFPPIMLCVFGIIRMFSLFPLYASTWSFGLSYCAVTAIGSRLLARGPRNKVTADLAGYNVLVTGGTSGIGLETAVELAKMGANVHVIARNSPHAAAALERIKKSAAEEAEIKFTAVDFCDLVQVRDFVRRLRAKALPIDVLVNNAGILSNKQCMTKYGDDEVLVVNLLAPYLLTEGLLPLVEKASGRIVNVASNCHCIVGAAAVQKYLSGKGVWSEKSVGHKFDGLEHYGFTKLGNIFHAQELAVRSYPVAKTTGSRLMQAAAAAGTRIVDVTQQQPRYLACSVNPGGVLTHIYRNVPLSPLLHRLYYLVILVLRTPREGSQSVVNCCVRSDLVNGGYYMECKYLPTSLSKTACDVKERTSVLDWTRSRLQPYMKWD